MSDDKLTLQALKMLKAAYPRQKLTDDTIDVYLLALKDLPPDLLKAAITRLITRSIFFPTIAEIRSAAADLSLEQMGKPSPIAAWEMALTGNREQLQAHPEVAKAVHRSCGDFYNLRTSTMQAADRARFIEAYTGLINEQRQGVTELPAVKEYVALGEGNGAQEAIKQLADTLKQVQ